MINDIFPQRARGGASSGRKKRKGEDEKLSGPCLRKSVSRNFKSMDIYG